MSTEPIHSDLNWINLTPEEGHFHFGYYDRCPFDPSGRLHLALKIPQQERLPDPGETAVVGYVDCETQAFTPVLETQAWSHQLSALMNWLPHKPGTFCFSDMQPDGNEWRPVTRIYHVDDGHIGDIDTHLYNVSWDGKIGGGMDFSRIPRRGYSFARTPMNPDLLQPVDPEVEGIFFVDMDRGSSKLVVSYSDMIKNHPTAYGLEERYWWINQVMFNCDNTRAISLFRSAPTATKLWPWTTDMFTYRIDGSDLSCSLPNPYWRRAISHEVWGRTPREILVDADWRDEGNEYVVFEEGSWPLKAHRISKGLGPQGHLNFSPDGRWLAGDTYGRDGTQTLGLVEVKSGTLCEIGTFKHATPGAEGDIRCDLHPRWSADSRFITVDSIHEGARKIFLLDIEEVATELFSGQ